MVSRQAFLVMLRHAILFYVTAIISDTLKITSALQLRDIRNLIENLQQNEAKYNNERDDQSLQMGENNGYVAISSRELDALINQAANDVYNQYKNKNRERYLKDLKWPKDDKIFFEQGGERQQLFPKRTEKNPFQDVLSKIYGKSLESTAENDATRAYLIMNPRANLNEKDFRDISDTLSQILSDSTSKKIYSKRNPVKKERRYKGFRVADGDLVRRRNRESKELYSVPDSLEDFKPKRIRGDYGGGGGRTPIPYIRHRDIYEKD